ncbi:hypothetical protein LAD67_13045 [Escherichia coli]|nr:hypothetical protein [Escherichia coli]
MIRSQSYPEVEIPSVHRLRDLTASTKREKISIETKIVYDAGNMTNVEMAIAGKPGGFHGSAGHTLAA